MSLLVVGAGLPRTGTRSLKDALERLLYRPCYHMHEVFEHLDHVPFWRAALHGEDVQWASLLEPYAAAVDYPPSMFWRELAAAYPTSIVVLSLRRDGATWWDSVTSTIFNSAVNQPPPERLEWQKMLHELFDRMLPDWRDPDPAVVAAAAVRAYDAHTAAVRATFAGTGRLVEWQASEGWGPLCAALNLPMPSEPFPRVNTREDWLARNDNRQGGSDG
jgi:hypothetical protein